MEFRPDVACSIIMALYIAVALRTEWKSAPDFSFSSWRYHLGLSSILAFSLLTKPSIFPINLIIAAITLFCAIVANIHVEKAQATQEKLPLSQLLNTMMASLSLSLLLASPYYLFGGLKHIINYIQIVVFGPNRGIWIPNFPLDYTLNYYLTGRGGWMMGAWFWMDIMVLVVTLAAVVYRRQWD